MSYLLVPGSLAEYLTLLGYDIIRNIKNGLESMARAYGGPYLSRTPPVHNHCSFCSELSPAADIYVFGSDNGREIIVCEQCMNIDPRE